MWCEYYHAERTGRLDAAIFAIRARHGHESILTASEFLQEIKKMNDTKRPTHRAYAVTDGKKEGDKADWLEIGAVWPHSDGKGFDVVLKALPVAGRVVLRTIEPKAEA